MWCVVGRYKCGHEHKPPVEGEDTKEPDTYDSYACIREIIGISRGMNECALYIVMKIMHVYRLWVSCHVSTEENAIFRCHSKSEVKKTLKVNEGGREGFVADL